MTKSTQVTSQDQPEFLAPWTYLSPEYYELEATLFKNQWLLAGHISALRNAGDYITIDAVGERALIVMDSQGKLQAFHNVCRHRGARLLSDRGNCQNRITCPFHGWSYTLDGALRGVPLPDTFENLVKQEHGLKPLPLEVWQGLVFVSFTAQSQSVADRLASVSDEVSHYRIADMEPLAQGYEQLRPYNWKVIHDIDLQQLYGQDYCDRIEQGIPIAQGTINEKPASLWSVRHYQKLLPPFDHLPAHRQKSWWYIGMFPNAVLALYPDMVEYYMTIPVAVKQTRFIGQQFGLADARRETKAARFLSTRINSLTDAEDESFVLDMQEGMRSSAFPQPTLSSTEIGVRYFHQTIQSHFPVARLKTEPAPGTLHELNAELSR